MQEFTLALLQSIFPWVTIWVLAKYFLLQGKTNAELIGSLTREVLATKNPWAAQQALQVMAGEQRAKELLKGFPSGGLVEQRILEEEEETM